ncbi:MAG: hypothetical protein RL385_5135 [Pseudomonadota bacterium]
MARGARCAVTRARDVADDPPESRDACDGTAAIAKIDIGLRTAHREAHDRARTTGAGLVVRVVIERANHVATGDHPLLHAGANRSAALDGEGDLQGCPLGAACDFGPIRCGDTQLTRIAGPRRKLVVQDVLGLIAQADVGCVCTALPHDGRGDEAAGKHGTIVGVGGCDGTVGAARLELGDSRGVEAAASGGVANELLVRGI